MKIQALSMVKQLIKNIFNLVGLEVQRHQPLYDAGTQIYQAIKKAKTDTILDVGANTGQFALEIRKKGYNGKIVSFEPLISARKKLIEHASKDANWSVHEQAAIGDHNGFIDINISKNSVKYNPLKQQLISLNGKFNSVDNTLYLRKLNEVKQRISKKSICILGNGKKI